MTISQDTARALAAQFVSNMPEAVQHPLACRSCGGTGYVPAMSDCFNVQCPVCHGHGIPSPYRNSKD